MTVYFARDPATGLIKIGTTFSVQSRMSTLRVDHPLVVVEATIAGNRDIESRLHTLFLDDHVGHEWFRPTPRLEAAIIAIREGWFDPSTLPPAKSPILRAAGLKGHETRRRNRQERAA